MSKIQDEAYIELCQENEQLKAANTDLQRECTFRGAKIADLERLLIRAADALALEHSERTGLPDKNAKGCAICNLVADLRKAVE